MSAQGIRYQQPAPSLRPFITIYYWVDIPAGVGEQRDWLHPEWPNVRFLLDGGWRVQTLGGWMDTPPCALFGSTCRAAEVVGDSPSRLVGLGFLPTGYASLFESEAAALADRIVPLGDHIEGADDLYAALGAAKDDAAQAAALDAYFEARLAARPAAPELMRRAHAALLDPETTTVDGFAATLGVSTRHLVRLCRRLFGFPPKLLLRRQRFMRTLDAAVSGQGRPFGEILDAAYFDQSHFIRDFHLFMGCSPSHYFGLPRPLQNVALRERMNAVGVAFQALQAERMEPRPSPVHPSRPSPPAPSLPPVDPGLWP